MFTGIILINWNSSELILKQIAHLEKWQTACRIYVIDNASEPEQIDKLSVLNNQHTLVRLTSNQGYSGATNAGIKKALADDCSFILLLNTDSFLDESNFTKLIVTLKDRTLAGAVGPVIYHCDHNSVQNAGGKNPAWNYFTHLTKPLSDQPYEVDYLSGTVFLGTARMFEQLSTLDEDYFFSGEIADYCLKAKRKGYKFLIEPNSKAVHDISISSSNRHSLYSYYIVRNRYLYIWKNYTWLMIILAPYWIVRHLMHAFKSYKANKVESNLILLGIFHGLLCRGGRIK